MAAAAEESRNGFPAALETLIRKGRDPGEVASYFRGMEEGRRRALATGIMDVARDLIGNDELLRVNPVLLDEGWGRPETTAPALLATATLSELKRMGNRGIPSGRRTETDACAEILLDRKPPWLESWCNWLLDRSALHWPLVRRLVREVPCAPPESPNYVLGMIGGLAMTPSEYAVLDGLLADRGLLDDLVWRLFETEGTSEMRLPRTAGKFDAPRGWAYALRQLSALGDLDRARLLDAGLDALARDLDQEQTGWFARFHDYLEPTLDERATRTEAYLNIVASPFSTASSTAIGSLKALHKAGKLDTGLFLDQIERALFTTTKANAKQILRILSDLAKQDSANTARAVLLAATLLEHTDTEIQESALKLLERSGDPDGGEMRDAVQQRLAVMAPSVRNRAAEWIGATELAEALLPETDDAELQDVVARATDLPADIAKWFGLDSALDELRDLAGAAPAIRRYPPQGRRKLARFLTRRARKDIAEFLFFAALVTVMSPFLLVGFSIYFLWFIFTFLGRRATGRKRPKKPYRAPYRRLVADTIFGRSDRWHRFLVFLIPHRPYMREISWSSRYFESKGGGGTYIRPMYKLAMEPGVPFGSLGALMVCLELQLGDAGDRQLATDLLINTVEAGKLDGVMIGDACETLFAHGVIRPRRLAPQLSHAVQTSALHAQAIRVALSQQLPRIVALPRDSHLLLELYYELCVEAQEAHTEPAHRALLANIEGASKPAKAAKKLLAQEEGDPLPHRRAAAVVALRGRLERAERWAGRNITEAE